MIPDTLDASRVHACDIGLPTRKALPRRLQRQGRISDASADTSADGHILPHAPDVSQNRDERWSWRRCLPILLLLVVLTWAALIAVANSLLTGTH